MSENMFRGYAIGTGEQFIDGATFALSNRVERAYVVPNIAVAAHRLIEFAGALEPPHSMAGNVLTIFTVSVTAQGATVFERLPDRQPNDALDRWEAALMQPAWWEFMGAGFTGFAEERHGLAFQCDEGAP